MLCYLEFAVSILICAAVCALERGKRLGLEIECGRTASFLVMNGNYHVGSHAFGSENMEEPSRWHIILLKSTELSIFESVSRMKRTIPSVLFCFVSFTVIIWLWRCIFDSYLMDEKRARRELFNIFLQEISASLSG